MNKKRILKTGYIRHIAPISLAIVIAFVLILLKLDAIKSVSIAIIVYAVSYLIIMYYCILKYNLYVGYAQAGGGSFAYNANKNKGWIIFTTILCIFFIILGLVIYFNGL